jgi:uncharacterized protein (DUF433 family)
MINWLNCPEIASSADKVSGALVFSGSRVPLAALFENLEDGGCDCERVYRVLFCIQN